MHKTHFLLISAFALLLVGAGCSTTENTENETDNSNTKQSETSNNIPNNDSTNNSNTKTETTSDELNLAGVATEEVGTVSLTWSAPEDLKDKAESWRLLYGKDAKPTEPASWYFERGPSYFEKVWSELPSGPAHIRLCAVVDDKCEVYSNDLEVEIK